MTRFTTDQTAGRSVRAVFKRGSLKKTLRQIFKQLWFYRRSNSWLFIELVIIIAVSWFLVHQTWTPRYRIDAVPDGMKSEGVYVVSFDLLQAGHRDYDPQADGEEAFPPQDGQVQSRQWLSQVTSPAVSSSVEVTAT